MPTISKKELTEEELELMREKRRERRKREKEKKKMMKEQKKRAEVYAPKSSKINVVSADTLLGRYTNSTERSQDLSLLLKWINWVLF